MSRNDSWKNIKRKYKPCLKTRPVKSACRGRTNWEKDIVKLYVTVHWPRRNDSITVKLLPIINRHYCEVYMK